MEKTRKMSCVDLRSKAQACAPDQHPRAGEFCQYTIKGVRIKLRAGLEVWRREVWHSNMKTRLRHAIINFPWKTRSYWSCYQPPCEVSAKHSFQKMHLNESTQC